MSGYAEKDIHQEVVDYEQLVAKYGETIGIGSVRNVLYDELEDSATTIESM